jgi:diguanylate cyclase (GGDEF)-like protein
VLRSNSVSRQHAVLLAIKNPQKSAHFFRVLDGSLDGKRSTNGILINGKKQLSHVLEHGDEILFSKDTRAIYQVITAITHNAKSKGLISEIDQDAGKVAASPCFVKLSPLQALTDRDLSTPIRETLNQFIASPEMNPKPIVELNLVGKILYLNPAALYQFPDLDSLGLNHPLLQDLLLQLIPLVNPVQNIFTREVTINNKIFSEIIHFMPWSEVIRVHIGDITRQKHAEAVISYQIHYDPLTGLPNRKYLHEYLVKLLDRLSNDPQKPNQKLAILFLDIDRFKLINDSLGRVTGDLLLQAVSERLKGLLRQDDLLVRSGGDEFAIVVRNIKALDAVTQIAELIIQELTVPFMCGGHELHITTSIGVSIYPDHNTDVEELVHNADMAMYRAKAEGRNSVQFYVPNMQEQSFQRLVMENNLRRALDNDELCTYFQPQVDLETGKIVGLEALLRWQHVTLGSISPAKFIPLAEETGLIVGIGNWVLRCACKQARAWQEMGLPPIRIGVNLSIKQIENRDFINTLRAILEETEFDPHFLELEITEGIMMNSVKEKIAILNQFREMGIKLSIDDFGTGYSSLSYLKNLPIDTLKIDRSFIEHITHNEQDRAIVSLVINLSHSLNLTVIAEGVEQREQIDLLRSLGCDSVQGYFFHRALPASDIEGLLRAQGDTKPSS